jgi:DNA polymerase-1
MTLIAFWDTETNGLLKEATKMHCLGIIFSDGRTMNCADIDGYTPIRAGLSELSRADIRVSHNGLDFDERVARKLYPDWRPKGRPLDTLIISRLLFPIISRQGPNTHKLPGQLKTRHSLEAWGYRLGEKKDKEFDAGDWQTWSPEMSDYMMQDVKVLVKLWKYLNLQKPSQEAVLLEHDFAAIILRQEAWGFTFDMEKALHLQAELTEKVARLEGELIETYGEWWEPGKVQTPKADRSVKLEGMGFKDVTIPRFGVSGKPLRPYVGPPKCHFTEGAPFTPIKRVQFQPGSRDHVRKMLAMRHGWKPSKFTDKGAPIVDDEVLRALDYPEAPKLADFYAANKILGYVSAGSKAWITTAVREDDGQARQHGRVQTIGTYTYRCSHSNPNMGQIPSRGEYGHACRELFIARRGFTLVGFDGSGMQLRLLAHYLHRWDKGVYAGVFERGEDPHGFMRDSIGVDLMGPGDEGRKKGKTLNYALCFGGGERKLGSIIRPHAPDAEKISLGKLVKERMLPVFGTAFDDLKSALKAAVEENGYITGLDGRRAWCAKPHAALATLLQMGEAVVMKKSLVIFVGWLHGDGLIEGVDGAAKVLADHAAFGFCANVHDEVQADVRPEFLERYTNHASRCVAEAGRQLRVKCPLESDVKSGSSWADTH